MRILYILTALLTGALAVTAQTAGAQVSRPRPVPYSDAPAGSGNLPTQKIGPDDLISVSVYDAPEFTRTVRVAADGTILLPMMSSTIPAAGILPRELELRIAAALTSEHLIKDPSVIVTISEYFGHPIIVTGAVRNPVSFQAIGRVTLMDAITRAGGIATEAGPDIVVNTSQSAEAGLVRRIPIKLLLDASDPKLNLILTAGDEVRVPVADRISVLGNVKNTGSYPILDKSDNTVLGAVVLAGGFAGPKPKEAYIIRQDDTPQGKHQIAIPLQDIVDRKVPDVPLVAHDILFVPNNRRSDTLLTLAKILGASGSAASLVYVLR